MSKDARGSLENLEGLLLRARMQPGSLRTPQNLRHQNLQDLDARQMAEDLSADAAARRRQQRQQHSQQLEAKALDAYTKFQGALADHQQQMKRMKEISERAELRHERLSLLVEEANGMFLEFHPEQPVRRKPKLLHVDWQPPRVIDVDTGSAAWPAPRRVSVEYPGSAAWPASRRVSIEYPGSAPLPESRRVSVEYPVEPICPTEPLGRQGRASGWELDPEPMDLQEIAGLRVVSSGELQLPSTVPSAQAVKRGSMLVTEDSDSVSNSPTSPSSPTLPVAGALLFWSTCLSGGLRRVCQRRSPSDSGDASAGGLPEFAFEEMFSTQLSLTGQLEQGRYRKVTFVAYYPEVFRDLRVNAFGVPEESFMRSMCDGPLSGGQQGEGKSGMLFFASWDKRYLAKTVMPKEVTFFAEHLAAYHGHMKGFPRSLLPRFLGLYSLQFPKERTPAYLVVFENLFPAGLRFDAKYDLKGVLGQHRYVSPEQRAAGVEVLKDRNLVERVEQDPLRLVGGVELRRQLGEDVSFLEQHGRIDYSLLLGVASAAEADGKGIGGGFRTAPARSRPEVLYMGIIDILQEYTTSKAMESRFKSLKYGLKRSFRKQSTISDFSTAVSSAPPDHYAKRFLDFMIERLCQAL